MQPWSVVYVDLPWMIGKNGCVDPGLSTLEQKIYGGKAQLQFMPAENGRYQMDPAQFLQHLDRVDALVIYRCMITEKILEAAGPGLKVVGRQGVGYENLASELLEARGIIGFNIPDYCVDEVATHTLALVLALERRVIPQHVGLTQGKFDIYAGGIPRRLKNCSAGIIGFGRIGRAVSTRLRLFYGKVLACDPYVSADLMCAYGVDKTDLDTLLENSDVVLLHPLLNTETSGMLNSRAFSRMKPTSFLINAARGGLVQSRALFEAVASGKIAGAGLDVFSPEDPNKDEWYAKLLQLPNVVVSSHRAYLSEESQVSQRTRTAEGILHVLSTGQPPAVGHVRPELERRDLVKRSTAEVTGCH